MAEGSTSKSREQTPQDDSAGGRSRVIGWLLVPALVIGGLFIAGVHVGARYPDMLLTRGVLWLTKSEAERPPPAASEPVELVRLDFGWPLPAQAIVEEWVEKDDKSVKLRYRIEVEPQGEQLLVHHREPRFVEVQGRPIESYSNRAELEAQLLAAAFIPSLAASLDGKFIGVSEMDAYIERSLEVFVDDPEEREALARGMRSPQMMAMVEQKIADIWRSWVELWVGLEISSDQELHVESDAGVGVYRIVELDAETISLEFRFEHELSMSEIRWVLGAFASGAGDDPAKMEAELEGTTGGRTLVATATLRRDTLLPLMCSNQTDSWIQFPGEPRQDKREVHRYNFEWQ
jgi:hypothetical protein